MYQTILLAVLDGLAQAAISFMIAAGLTLIFGIMRILNAAHGSFYALGAYLAASLGLVISAAGLPEWLSYPAMLVAAVIIGVVIGPLLERGLLSRVYDKEPSLQILTTFGVFMVLEDVQKIIFGVEPYFSDAPLRLLGLIQLGGIYYTAYQLLVLPLTALAVMGLLLWFFNITRQGRLVTVVIEDQELAQAMGINTRRVYLLTFTFGTMLAALGGALASPTTSVVPGMGADAIVLSFAIVATAGLGHFVGAAITAFIICLGRALAIYLFPELETVMPYLIMVVILVARPYGLFGQAQVKRV